MSIPLRTLTAVVALAFLCATAGYGQTASLKSYSLAAANPVSSIIPSNSISHIAVRGTTLWIGTGKGLARSSDGGRTWESFARVTAFAQPGIFAIAVSGDTIWCSTGYDKPADQGTVQTGSGYAYSIDNGATWVARPQPLDARNDSVVQYGNNQVSFLPIVVPEQNVTFDIALSTGQVWIASWSSGLRHSTDLGQTWQRVVLPSFRRTTIAPTDSLGYYPMDPREDNNFLMFSVFAESDSIIWAGSAGGVNKSTDGGRSWVNFTSHNQAAPIRGNWVIAIAGQPLSQGNRIWITNWPTDTSEIYGVGYTEDGGRTWRNFLPGVKAYAFAFKDTVAYVAAETGLYRTGDGGKTWQQSGTINVQGSDTRIETSAFFSAGVIGDTVYGGTADGLAKTIDNASHAFGASWQAVRAYQPLASTGSAYAYPNPFSPRIDVARIHYKTSGASASVTIEIFDFGMNRVKTVLKDAQRTGAGDHDEPWSGQNDRGKIVPNGVYFYRVILDGGDPIWGKIMVIQ